LTRGVLKFQWLRLNQTKGFIAYTSLSLSLSLSTRCLKQQHFHMLLSPTTETYFGLKILNPLRLTIFHCHRHHTVSPSWVIAALLCLAIARFGSRYHIGLLFHIFWFFPFQFLVSIYRLASQMKICCIFLNLVVLEEEDMRIIKKDL
jgi:hypothetical protein